MAVRRRSEVVSEFLSRRYGALLLGIVAFGLLMRIATYFSLRAADIEFFAPSLDSQAFLAWARNIASGDILGDEVFFLNPLYPYFLAPIVSVFGPEPLLEIRLIQMVLGLAIVPLVAGAARRFLGRGFGLGAGLFAAAWPLLLYYEQYVMIVTLAVFLNTLAMYLIARLPEKPTLRRAFVAGLPLGLAILARPNVGLFAVLLPIWLLVVAPPGRRVQFAVTRTLVLAFGAALMVAPCTWRNWYVGDDFVAVTSSSGVNLYVSNNPKARKYARMTSEELRPNPRLIETDAIVFAERETGRDMKPSEVSAFWKDRAVTEFRKAPGASLRYLFQKLLMFFRADEIPSSYHFANQRKETPLFRFTPLSWGLLSPFMLLGVFLTLFRRPRALPLALLFIAYAVGLAIFFPLAHYRIPVAPGAFGLGALGIAAIAAPILDLRWAALARIAPAAALATVLAYPAFFGDLVGYQVIQGAPDDQVVYWYNRGQTLIGLGRIDEAEEAYRKGLAADPTSWLSYKGLARVARARDEPGNERRHLEAALERRPRDPGTRILYAQCLLDFGEVERAFRIGNETVQDAPNDGEVLTGLALMCWKTGGLEDALELFRRAEFTGLPRRMIIFDQCRILRRLERYREALENAERGLELDAGDPNLLYEKAIALLRLGAPESEVRALAEKAAETGVRPPPELEPLLSGEKR